MWETYACITWPMQRALFPKRDSKDTMSFDHGAFGEVVKTRNHSQVKVFMQPPYFEV